MTKALTAEQEAWIRAQPPEVQAKVREYPATVPYRLKGHGQTAWILDYNRRTDTGACETATVRILRMDNPGDPQFAPGGRFAGEQSYKVADVPFADLERIPEGAARVRRH